MTCRFASGMFCPLAKTVWDIAHGKLTGLPRRPVEQNLLEVRYSLAHDLIAKGETGQDQLCGGCGSVWQGKCRGVAMLAAEEFGICLFWI